MSYLVKMKSQLLFTYTKLVEMAGFEPASAKDLNRASTCVAGASGASRGPTEYTPRMAATLSRLSPHPELWPFDGKARLACFELPGQLRSGVTRCRLGSEEGWSLNWGRCVGPDGLHVLDGVHFTVGS